MNLRSKPPRTMTNHLLSTMAVLAAAAVHRASCLDADLLDNKPLVKSLLRHKRDIFNLTDIASDLKEKMRLKMDAYDYAQQETTEWEPILYRFTTQSSAEIGRMATWFTEISDFVQAYRYNRTKTTPDTRPENPDDTWTLGRPRLKGDMVGKPFHDPPWRLDQLKYLHCHIDDCKAWFKKSDYKSYVLHMYDHFFNQKNFYVTWPPYVDKQNFTCYNHSCGQVFESPGRFFEHVHEHLIEEDVTERTLFTTELTIGVAEFFSPAKTSTPKQYFKQSCYICKAVYYTKDSLDKHLIWHAFNGSFLHTPKRLTLPPPECVACNLQFSSEAKQDKHWAEVHPKPGVHLKLFREFYGHDTRNNPDPEGFPCPMCPKRCMLPSRMEKHLLWHARHSPPEEQWPPKRANKVYIVYGNTIPDDKTTPAEIIFHDPPNIKEQLDQCKRELDEIDRKYTTPVYPQPEYVNDESCLTSEREDSRTLEQKIPQTEELDEMDPNTSRYLEAALRKPPKFCRTCHFITNDTLVFNRHYSEHCWDVARLKLKLRSDIYDRMDKLYEEADRIRRKEWKQGLFGNDEDDFGKRRKRSATETVPSDAGGPIDEKTRKEFEQIRRELEKDDRKRRDVAENIAESVEYWDGLSNELKERHKRELRSRRELDLNQIKLELQRAMFTVPYELGQACESCNRTDFKDKAEYTVHLQEHIANQSFFNQFIPSPPTPYRSLEFVGYHTTKSRNGSDEVRFRKAGQDIINEFQDFEIAKRRGLDNRTMEQFRRDRAIELGLRFGLLRTRKTTLPPAPPPPSSKEINAKLNQKLNDVKEKLKQYQERKNRGNKENQTDASKEIDHKIEDLKRKMEDIKQKYNTTNRRAKRSPGSKVPKDRIKAVMMAEMKQKEKQAKKKGITLNDPFKTEFDILGGQDILGRTTKGKKRSRRDLPDDVKDEFLQIQNGTYFDRFDKDMNDKHPEIVTRRKSTTTTETPFPAIVDFGNGTTISLLSALKLMKSKISVVMERYKQIHNMKGVTWNMELLKKYNMIEPINEIREKTAKLNRTEMLQRIAQFEYFDQWEPEENKTTPRPTTTISERERLEHEKNLKELHMKFRDMKAELHAVIMKHFNKEDLDKLEPAVRRKIEGLVEMTNSTEPAKRPKREARTEMVFTPRPYFEMCSQCSVNFTRKTEYYKHEFEHIYNESFLDQADPTMNADMRYDQWKAERDNKTTPYAIDVLLSKQTLPIFDDNANVEEMKKYFVTKIHELSSKCHFSINVPAELGMRKATSPLFDIDAHTFQPINRTEIVEVFRRVEQYYANQDRIEKEKAELEKLNREAMAGTKPARRKRHIE